MYVFVVINDYGDENEYKPETFGLSIKLPVATSSTNQLIDHALQRRDLGADHRRAFADQVLVPLA